MECFGDLVPLIGFATRGSITKNYGILGDLVPSLGFALPLHIA